MKRILITCTILVSFTLKSQKTGIDSEVNLFVNSVSSDSLRSSVEKLVCFGTRHTMSSTSDPVWVLVLPDPGCCPNSGPMPQIQMDVCMYISKIRMCGRTVNASAEGPVWGILWHY